MSKNIIRVSKDKDNPYVMMNKLFLSDNRLSWKSKGILSYLLSKPDDWEIVIEDLIKQSTDGEKAVRSGLDELKSFKYLQRYPVYVDGIVDHWESVVYEQPYNGEQIKSIIIDNGEEKINLLFHNGNVDGTKENQVLSQNLQVDNLQVENLHGEKEGLLITDCTDNEMTNNYEEEKTISDIYSLYKEIKNNKLSNIEKKKLKELTNLYNCTLIFKAIDVMVEHTDEPSISYLRSTLKDWHKRGLDAIEKVEQGIARHELDNEKANENKKKKITALAEGTQNYRKQTDNFNNYAQRDKNKLVNGMSLDDIENGLNGW